MKVYKPPHYTALKQGDLWLMTSGRIAQLIGTKISGDASFLFKYSDDGGLVLTYPGLPCMKDEPLVNYSEIQELVKDKITTYKRVAEAGEITRIMDTYNKTIKL